MDNFKVGDSIKALAACERLPVGTIVAYAHPVYQMPISAVRVETHDGSLFWSEAGRNRLTKTRTIKQATGWAPFMIVWLPGESEPLNTDVRIGHRTYGPPVE